MNIVTIVQMRMGSTRLPGKSMQDVLGKPLIGYILERLQRVKHSQTLVLATTTHPRDDVLEKYCHDYSFACFRGSEDDVLDRYYQCALKYKADAIVRICGDCPLIDPQVVDQVIQNYLDLLPAIDYVSNTMERTYPRGMDTEIFSTKSFEKVVKEANTLSQREHVTSYYYLHPESFKLKNVSAANNCSEYRLTVDVDADFQLIRRIIEELYPKNPNFDLNDVIEVLHHHPEWKQINAHVQQKSI